MANFCTCKNFNCPLHPSNHDKGCDPCVSKNLKLREIPNCFFQKLNSSERRTGSTFEDFAELALKNKVQ